MARARQGLLARAGRKLHRAVFDVSQTGRAGEIAAWANAASALVIGSGVAALSWGKLPVHGAWAGVAAAVIAFLGLRLSLTHRATVWIAGALGTLTVAALGGALAWLFAHVVDVPAVPTLAAIVGALLAALVPAWGYAQLARRRDGGVRDSLIDPLSVPRSR